MFSRRKKYEVTDPGYYDQLIYDHKKQMRKNKTDPAAWQELGRLYEARAAMTKEFINKKFFLRNSFSITLLFSIITVFSFNFLIQSQVVWGVNVIVGLLFVFSLIFMWNLRYPRSGKKYYKKAIALDPGCGDAYLYLGQIALRKNQKTKAWRFMEKAIQLNAKNKIKIKRELEFLYEHEFVRFFGERSKIEINQQEIIDSQLFKNRTLRRQNADLQKKNESLSGKIGQVKWESGHQVKIIDQKMEHAVSLIRKEYEDKIAALKQESEDDAKEMAQLKYIKLTTEIMESKSSLEKQSFSASARIVENILGSSYWKMLPENIQIYLATAEQIYTVLKNQNENTDYSLVGMELCKALETMLNQTLVEPFVEYVKNNQADFLKVNQIGEKLKKPVYFTYLSMVVDQINYPEIDSLTLGQYLFVLSRTLDSDYALREYADFLDKTHADSGSIIGEKFSDKLEIVIKQYRNTIVHRLPMNKEQYEHLRQLVLAGKDSLLINLRVSWAYWMKS